MVCLSPHSSPPFCLHFSNFFQVIKNITSAVFCTKNEVYIIPTSEYKSVQIFVDYWRKSSILVNNRFPIWAPNPLISPKNGVFWLYKAVYLEPNVIWSWFLILVKFEIQNFSKLKIWKKGGKGGHPPRYWLLQWLCKKSDFSFKKSLSEVRMMICMVGTNVLEWSPSLCPPFAPPFIYTSPA